MEPFLEKVRSKRKELFDTIDEIGSGGLIGVLKNQEKQIKVADENLVQVGISYSENLTDDEVAIMNSWLGISNADIKKSTLFVGRYCLHFLPAHLPMIKQLDKLPFAIHIHFQSKREHGNDASFSRLKFLTKNTPIIINVANENIEFGSNPNYTTRYRICKKWEEIQNHNFSDDCSKWIGEQNINLLKAFSHLAILEISAALLSESISLEQKTTTLKKTMSGQYLAVLKSGEARLNFNEVLSQIRNLVTGQISEFEKSIKSHYDDLNKPNIGDVFKIAEKNAQSIADFQRESKLEKIHISVSVAKQEEMKGEIVRLLEEAFNNDAIQFQKMVFELNDKINSISLSHDQPRLELATKGIDSSIQKKVIEAFGYFQKNYTGELEKEGISDFFISVRDYTGLIGTVMGILAPFLALVNILSQENPEQKKLFEGKAFMEQLEMFGDMSFRQKTNVIVASLTLVMLIYGIFFIIRSVPKKREEIRMRELKKARELYFGELRRMAMDASREWVTLMSVQLREMSTQILQQVERTYKENNTLKGAVLNEERSLTNRQISGADSNLRKISNLERKRDNIVADLKKIRMEMNQQFDNSIPKSI